METRFKSSSNFLSSNSFLPSSKYSDCAANALETANVNMTIIFNKNKDEVARIKGSVDFSDKKFISWLDSIE